MSPQETIMRAALDSPQESLGKCRKVCATLVGLVVVTLCILGYRFRGHLSSAFGFVAEGTGGKTIAVLILIGAFLVLVCVFFWMIFPILVYFGLKNLSRRMARLDHTTELCARQLALLAAQQNVSSPEPAPEENEENEEKK